MTELVRGWEGIPGWLDPVEGAVLAASVRSTNGAIVELGTWCGRSLICLAAARASLKTDAAWARPLYSFDLYPEASQASVAAIDGVQVPPSEAKRIAKSALKRFGVPNVHLRYIDAIEAAAKYDGPRIGLLYVDDDHSGERVLAELAAWEPHLLDDCEVCLHDFFHEPYGLEAAVDRWILAHPEWVLIEARLSMARFRRRWKAAPRAPAATVPAVATPMRSYGTPPRTRPLVSVLYNTWRLGGLDCLKVGLDRQTLNPREFEVVIVDALYPYAWRCQAVAALFKDAPYSVKHLNVTGNPFPRDAGNRARNDALRAASGDVCVWWCDYSIADPESLERHYAKVGHSGFRASSVGIICYGEIDVDGLHPALRAALPWQTIDDYADFVASLPADSPLWTTIFNAPVVELGRQQKIATQCGHALPYDLIGKVTRAHYAPTSTDERSVWLNGLIPDFYYYAKNEATARDVLVEINGWEESFDDGHTNDDTDIGRRLSLVGSVMQLDKGNECFVPNPRPFFPLLRWKRAPIDNRRLFETLRAMNRSRAIQGIVNELDQIPRRSTAPSFAEASA